MSKHIVIFTIGTLGDVRPYIALGKGLLAAGHSVTIAGPENFQALVEEHGLGFSALMGDIQEYLRSDTVSNAMEKGIVRNLPSLLRGGKEMFANLLEKAWHISQDADMLILQAKTLAAADCAEALKLPCLFIGLQPLTPTGQFPIPGGNFTSLGAIWNKLSYMLLRTEGMVYGELRNELRQRLMGLPARSKFASSFEHRGARLQTLYGFSQHVVPRPADWPSDVSMAGYLFLEDETDWQPDYELEAFIDAGEPPVYIGFGSMPWGSTKNTAAVLEGLRKWGGRALVDRGWGGIETGELPDNVYAIEPSPHDVLLPMTAGVVHHGGAGTTAAALNAGRPSFACPFCVDQFFWGERVSALRAGPEPLPAAKLDPSTFAIRLSEMVSNQLYRKAAKDVQRKLAAENGVAAAIEVIERRLKG